MVAQFNGATYGNGTFTGWENHRGVRYRAVLAALPTIVDSYQRGRQALGVDPANVQQSDDVTASEQAVWVVLKSPVG